MIDTQLIHLKGHPIRVSVPQGNGPHPVIFLIHGWKGNEDVMWIFANKIPKHYLMVAPRAIYPAQTGGYSWVDRNANAFSTYPQFEPAVTWLWKLKDQLASQYNGSFNEIDLLGFSQGAALSLAYMVSHSVNVRSVAGLAGFCPTGVESAMQENTLSDKPVFIAHGNRDKTVPLENARITRSILEKAGANLTFIEDDVGHKMGIKGLRALQEFYQSL